MVSKSSIGDISDEQLARVKDWAKKTKPEQTPRESVSVVTAEPEAPPEEPRRKVTRPKRPQRAVIAPVPMDQLVPLNVRVHPTKKLMLDVISPRRKLHSRIVPTDRAEGELNGRIERRPGRILVVRSCEPFVLDDSIENFLAVTVSRESNCETRAGLWCPSRSLAIRTESSAPIFVTLRELFCPTAAPTELFSLELPRIRRVLT